MFTVMGAERGWREQTMDGKMTFSLPKSLNVPNVSALLKWEHERKKRRKIKMITRYIIMVMAIIISGIVERKTKRIVGVRT